MVFSHSGCPEGTQGLCPLLPGFVFLSWLLFQALTCSVPCSLETCHLPSALRPVIWQCSEGKCELPATEGLFFHCCFTETNLSEDFWQRAFHRKAQFWWNFHSEGWKWEEGAIQLMCPSQKQPLTHWLSECYKMLLFCFLQAFYPKHVFYQNSGLPVSCHCRPWLPHISVLVVCSWFWKADKCRMGLGQAFLVKSSISDMHKKKFILSGA